MIAFDLILCDASAFKDAEDPDLSDLDEVFTVLTQPQSAVQCSPALKLLTIKHCPALYAALARVTDLRVREAKLKA